VLPAAVVGAIEGCKGAKCEGNDGKPDSIMFGTIMTVIGLEREQCVMSRDRLYTDIARRKAPGCLLPSY
jgi:ribonucleotide monophosphatase NagD (HAD superfamily)